MGSTLKSFISISSSLVREKILRGEPINDLVPASVLKEIRRRGLYKAA